MDAIQIGPWRGYDPRDDDWHCSYVSLLISSITITDNKFSVVNAVRTVLEIVLLAIALACWLTRRRSISENPNILERSCAEVRINILRTNLNHKIFKKWCQRSTWEIILMAWLNTFASGIASHAKWSPSATKVTSSLRLDQIRTRKARNGSSRSFRKTGENQKVCNDIFYSSLINFYDFNSLIYAAEKLCNYWLLKKPVRMFFAYTLKIA